ncbi:hypothetical protein VTN31DRAFT_5752 [Thermomyces dupontii]|uniref:uncharacterized protein n=1 Tax=Talaromyces thermophilus TaxID=28565 RepID=UPI003744574A
MGKRNSRRRINGPRSSKLHGNHSLVDTRPRDGTKATKKAVVRKGGFDDVGEGLVGRLWKGKAKKRRVRSQDSVGKILINDPEKVREQRSGKGEKGKRVAETRRKLIEHSTKEGCNGLSNHLTEVIAHLERLIEQDLARHRRAATEKTHTSKVIGNPTTASKSTETPELLPCISKEALTPLDNGSWYDLQRVNHHESSPGSPNVMTSKEETKTHTIRMLHRQPHCRPVLDWTFDHDTGKMRKRQMSGNDILIGPNGNGEGRWFVDGVDVNDVRITEEHW